MDLHRPTGKHLLLEGYYCDSAALDDADTLAHILGHAAMVAGATVLQIAKQKFEPQGASVVLVLAESHISIHTYPEHQMFMADIFTCGDDCEPLPAAEFMIEALAPKEHTIKLLQRGQNGVAPTKKRA